MTKPVLTVQTHCPRCQEAFLAGVECLGRPGLETSRDFVYPDMEWSAYYSCGFTTNLVTGLACCPCPVELRAFQDKITKAKEG